MLRSLALLAVSAAAPLLPVRVADIQWAPSFDEALEVAASEEKVIFIAVNMDGERANDQMAEKVYKERDIQELAAETVNLIASAGRHRKSGKCPRFGCVSCEQHRFVDIAVREQVLKPSATGAVIAPQHVFCEPDGSVILSVPYGISASELEWCFYEATAIQGGVELADRSHPGRRPRRLIVGDVAQLGGGNGPVTRDEALELIATLKKGGNGGEQREMIRRLATSDEPEAREYVLSALRSGGGGARGGGGGRGGRGGGRGGNSDRERGQLLRWIGEQSPASYWEVCIEFADSGADEVKREAIVALEQLGAEDSLAVLMKALRRSRSEPKRQKNVLRAIGSVARDDRKARAALLKASVDRKQPLIRANALLGLGWLDADEGVSERLKAAALPAVHGGLAKVDEEEVTAEERLAAVVAMGISRHSEWKPLLEELAAAGEEPALKDAAQASLGVLEGRPYAGLRSFLETAGSDEIPRERLFGRGRRGRGDRGDGERGGGRPGRGGDEGGEGEDG
ncbi:MAG: HEAT repeat domain-containing protein [Planctomycetota bacterium]